MNYQAKLLDKYDKIREYEAKQLKERKAEIQKLYPEIIELDQQIQKLSVNMSLALIKSEDSEKTFKEYKNQIIELRAQKCEMLAEHGYDIDYLQLHYQCPKCQDTGFIGINKCTCYEKKLIEVSYKNSFLEDILRYKNFDNFDINLFSNSKKEDELFSPRKNMEDNLNYILGTYLPEFNNSNVNLLFYGNPGSGKSFLSYCIAKELLDKGFGVIYKTADELIQDLINIRFNNNTTLENMLVDCDLLIIDDLGAEQKNELSVTELFNLINKKLLKNKKMLVSTNLSIADITKIYSERFCSRLLGEFKLRKFFSDDIRIKLNLKNNKK